MATSTSVENTVKNEHADSRSLLSWQNVLFGLAAVALSFLAVGLIYLWWERPDGVTGICLAVLSTIALSLSILSKLLAVSTLVPVGMLMLAHCWRIAQQEPGKRLASARSLIAGILAFVVITLIVLLPFAGSWQQFWHSVVTFHTDASTYFK